MTLRPGVERQRDVTRLPNDAEDLAVFPVVTLDATLVQRAARRSASEPISHWDALILEAAIESGADAVYSEDLQPGSGYRGVTVVDPFAG